MKYHRNLIWGVVVIPFVLLFTGCKIFPLKSNNSSGETPNTTETPGPAIPPLSSAEFLKDSTYIEPHGALHSIKDKKPVTGVLVAFHPNGRKKSEINYIDHNKCEGCGKVNSLVTVYNNFVNTGNILCMLFVSIYVS